MVAAFILLTVLPFGRAETPRLYLMYLAWPAALTISWTLSSVEGKKDYLLVMGAALICLCEIILLRASLLLVFFH